MISGATLHYTE